VTTDGSTTPTLYLPADANGNASIDLGGDFDSTDDFTIYGDYDSGADPTDGSFDASGEQNVSLNVFDSDYGDYDIVVSDQNGDSEEVDVVVMGWEIDATVVSDVPVPSAAVLPQDQKQDPGAFVPVDNGDYDYNGTPDNQQASPPPGVATGTPAGAKWVAPIGGAIQTGAGSGDVTILWNNQPITGEARLLVDSDYQWDVDVNVVEVSVQSPNTGDPFSPGAPIALGLLHGGPTNLLEDVVSAGGLIAGVPPGLSWAANVTLNGPDGNRGVSHIQVGFIQNLVGYTNIGTYTSGKTLTSSVSGIFSPSAPVLDQIPNLTTGPWYETAVHVSTGLPSAFLNPTASKNSETISASDSPRTGPPVSYDQPTGNAPGPDVLQSMQLVFQFVLDVAARTTDTQSSADNIYTPEATSSWSFVGSGTFPGGAWAGVNAAITPPNGGWSAVPAGAPALNVNTETIANSDIRSQTFK
jgi:hypothetical protein